MGSEHSGGARSSRPASLAGGVFANDVHVFHDLDYATLDFLSIDPRGGERATVVARVTASSSCILKLRHHLEAFE